MVLTGVNNVEAFALGSTFGVGFEYTIGAGVAIMTGCPFNEYNGLYFFVRSPSLWPLPTFIPPFTRSPALTLPPTHSNPSTPLHLRTPFSLLIQSCLGEITFLGSGVMIQTGCPAAEYVGQASENGQVRRDGGEGGRGAKKCSRREDVASQTFSSFLFPSINNQRQGGNTYVGAGYGSWTGVVLIEFISIANVAMLGEYIAVDGKRREGGRWLCYDP